MAKNELIWLAGNSFYGTKQIFEPEFMEWLAGFRLPEYELTRRDGQYELRFEGSWAETTMWEIPALAIINELRARVAMRGMSRFDLDVLYARAKAKLWSKVERLRTLAAEGPLRVSDFGTRRRHGFLWQRWCVEALQEGLGRMKLNGGFSEHSSRCGETPWRYSRSANERFHRHRRRIVQKISFVVHQRERKVYEDSCCLCIRHRSRACRGHRVASDAIGPARQVRIDGHHPRCGRLRTRHAPRALRPLPPAVQLPARLAFRTLRFPLLP